jgi:hypothetical protein
MRGKINQWEVVEVNFYLPQGGALPHPCLIISNDELFESDDFFYAVLMTTKNQQGYFATHIISSFNMGDVISRHNTFLKPEYRDKVKHKIIQSIF